MLRFTRAGVTDWLSSLAGVFSKWQKKNVSYKLQHFGLHEAFDEAIFILNESSFNVLAIHVKKQQESSILNWCNHILKKLCLSLLRFAKMLFYLL